MTNVLFDVRQLAPDLTAWSGIIRLRPSREFTAGEVSSHPLVKAEMLERALVNGQVTINLRPTDADTVPWCWLLLDDNLQPVIGLQVPTGAITLNARDLVTVDPSTLAVTTDAPAAWYSALTALATRVAALEAGSGVTGGGVGSSTVDGITDAGDTGKAVMKATTAAAARTAISAPAASDVTTVAMAAATAQSAATAAQSAASAAQATATAAVSTATQTLTAAQQAQARINIGTAAVVTFTSDAAASAAVAAGTVPTGALVVVRS